MRHSMFSRFAIFYVLSVLGITGCTTSSTQLGVDDTGLADMSFAPPIPSTKPGEPMLAVTNVADEAMIREGEVQVSEAQGGDVQVDGVQAESFVASLVPPSTGIRAFSGGSRDRDCLMRAMYFESNRSSKEGMLAVGTVVMNRVSSGQYPSSVCGVVGQKRQFAPGVMSRRIQGNTSDLAALANAILAGKRHPRLYRQVMHFHQAGLKFRYGNMRYVLNAGGNSFYEKVSRKRRR